VNENTAFYQQIFNLLIHRNSSSVWRLVTWIQICESFNHRK